MPFKNIFAERNEKRRAEYRAKCRPEVLKIADQEAPVTVAQYYSFETMNSYEQQILMRRASEELVIDLIKRFLPECRFSPDGLSENSIACTYDEIVFAILLPKLL